MTEPSEAAKKLACELANEHDGDNYWKAKECAPSNAPLLAVALYIDKVDRVARLIDAGLDHEGINMNAEREAALRSLMLPDEPDPLEEAIEAAFPSTMTKQEVAKIRAELKKRGLTIAEEK